MFRIVLLVVISVTLFPNSAIASITKQNRPAELPMMLPIRVPTAKTIVLDVEDDFFEFGFKGKIYASHFHDSGSVLFVEKASEKEVKTLNGKQAKELVASAINENIAFNDAKSELIKSNKELANFNSFMRTCLITSLIVFVLIFVFALVFICYLGIKLKATASKYEELSSCI